jgi:small conductance mechanosensitive channel
MTDWTGWAQIASFMAAWEPLLFVIGVIVGAIVLRGILRFAIRRVVERVVTKKEPKTQTGASQPRSPLATARIVQRTRTLGSVLSNTVTAAIVVVSVLLIFSKLMPDATGAFALITAAVGAGLGFGAQNVVKDVLNGLFLIGDDQLGVGDSVDLGVASGVVESVGIQVTRLRDENGTLWFVRNGEILRVGNMSYESRKASQ